MNTSSSDLRSLPTRVRGSEPGRRIQDTKSPPAAPAGVEIVETADPADGAAFGEFLRQARERRQLTLEQIAEDTKISSRHLNALEQGNVKALPSGMYRRAMLRAYAESVGLDKETALDQFERTFEPRERAAAPRPAAPAPLPSAPAAPVITFAPRDPRVLLIVVAVAATAVVGLITGDSGPQPAAFQAPAPVSSRPAGTTPPAAAAADTPPAPGLAAPVSTLVAAPERVEQEASTTAAARGGTGSEVVTATTGRTDGTPDAVPPAPRATEGELVIVTEPAGARVTVNGTGWGVSPVTVRHLPFGAKRVRVTNDGYVSQERVITVSPARPSATVRLGLERRN